MAQGSVEIVDSSELPLCPHCEREIERLLSKKIESQVEMNLGVRYVYFCGHCKKVLGVSHRKGFWMG